MHAGTWCLSLLFMRKKPAPTDDGEGWMFAAAIESLIYFSLAWGFRSRQWIKASPWVETCPQEVNGTVEGTMTQAVLKTPYKSGSKDLETSMQRKHKETLQTHDKQQNRHNSRGINACVDYVLQAMEMADWQAVEVCLWGVRWVSHYDTPEMPRWTGTVEWFPEQRMYPLRVQA